MTGGRFVEPENLLNPGSLDWVLETIQAPSFFGIDRYPRLSDKAALLAWIIIDGHVFVDGNKRTGISALITFARVNGYNVRATLDDIERIAIEIGSGHENRVLSPESFAQWIEERLTLRLAG